MRTRLPVLMFALLAACSRNSPPSTSLPDRARHPAPESGTALLQMMHDQYRGTWYKTLTFTQKTIYPDREETWYEAMELPGRLRIDIAPLSNRNAVIFRRDSIYTIEGGKVVRSGAFVHPLMVLGFDVYGDPVSRTADRMKSVGIDLETISQNDWQGRPVYVVGAARGDSTTPQFWVDAERLVFVRLIERRPPPPNNPDAGPTRIETQFNDYRRLGGGWISPEVRFLVGGQERLREEYSDMRADVELGDALFEPTPYTPPAWVK